MMYIPKPQEIYRHFKGNLYQIITVAEHSETGERLVIYQALYGDFKIYARELGMFMSRVDRNKYPNASQEYRFELQTALGQEKAIREAPKETAKETKQEGSGEIPSKEAVHKETVPKEAEAALDPMLLEFLDADTYEARLNILAGLHHRITQDMITTMAVSCDIEVGDGEVEERYQQLKNCLITLEKYECNRLR